MTNFSTPSGSRGSGSRASCSTAETEASALADRFEHLAELEPQLVEVPQLRARVADLTSQPHDARGTSRQGAAQPKRQPSRERSPAERSTAERSPAENAAQQDAAQPKRHVYAGVDCKHSGARALLRPPQSPHSHRRAWRSNGARSGGGGSAKAAVSQTAHRPPRSHRRGALRRSPPRRHRALQRASLFRLCRPHCWTRRPRSSTPRRVNGRRKPRGQCGAAAADVGGAGQPGKRRRSSKAAAADEGGKAKRSASH